MKDLESRLEITERDLEKSRKDFHTAGDIFHFGGESILVLGLLGGIVPIISKQGLDYKSIGIGVGIYLLTQPPAFWLKALSKTKEENKQLANKYTKLLEEDLSNENLIITKINFLQKMNVYFTERLIRYYNKVANNYERYEATTVKYTAIKKRIFN